MPLRTIVKSPRLAINITETIIMANSVVKILNFKMRHFWPALKLQKRAVDIKFAHFRKVVVCRKIFFRLTPPLVTLTIQDN
jgi:hypothetical protein